MINPDDIRSFDETISLDVTPYVCLDDQGRQVQIMPKSGDHFSYHPEENHPTVFHNVGQVLTNYDRVFPSTSTNPRAVEALQIGQVMVYEQDGFFDALDVPGFDRYPDHTIRVAVMYESQTGKNYTKSYQFKKVL